MNKPIDTGQLRAAMASIDMSANKLSALSEVSPATIYAWRKGNPPRGYNTANKVETCLREQGITFLPDDGNGPGIRYKAPT